MSPRAGLTYGGRYTLLDRIAVGGMGEVWRAEDQVLGRVVAIKLLAAALADQPGFAQRFREEARHTALLAHHNIATVFDYGEDGGAGSEGGTGGGVGSAWLVMELVHGRPLSQIIADEGPLTAERTARIVAQVADGLGAAHAAGVIHRDVKPANILIRPDGVVKITDFGIARVADAAPLTRTGEVMGTAQYISPEQAQGRPVSPASDLYSLACVAFEMLTGSRPFDRATAIATAMAHISDPVPPLPSSVPTALAAVIQATLAKDPARRPSSAREFADAIRGLPGAAYGATQALATQGTPAQQPPAPTQHVPAPATLPPTQPPSAQLPPTAIVTPPTAGGAAYQTGYPAYDGPSSPPTGGRPAVAPPTVAPPEEPARRSAAIWLIPLLLVLVGVAAFAAMNTFFGGSSTTPTPSATRTTAQPTASATTSSPTTTSAPPTTITQTVTLSPTTTRITIDENDFIGAGLDDARARLDELGIEFVTVQRAASDEEAGTVLAIDPTGSVTPQTPITLTVSSGPVQTPTTAPQTSSTPTETTSAAPQTEGD